MPIPSAADDIINRWIVRAPPELAANFLGDGYKDSGRVATAPCSFLHWDCVTYDVARGLDHLPDTESFVVA